MLLEKEDYDGARTLYSRILYRRALEARKRSLGKDHPMDPTIQTLITQSWDLWHYAREAYSQFIPQDSAPILWFGNTSHYQKSEIKIIILGFNPDPLAGFGLQPWQLYHLLETSETLAESNAYKRELDLCLDDSKRE